MRVLEVGGEGVLGGGVGSVGEVFGVWRGGWWVMGVWDIVGGVVVWGVLGLVLVLVFGGVWVGGDEI